MHADHPTLNRARRRAARAPASASTCSRPTRSTRRRKRQWLRPLDDLVDPRALAPLAPRAVELCRFDGALLCVPRLVDVRVLWVRADRVDRRARHVGRARRDRHRRSGSPAASRDCSARSSSSSSGAGGALFDATAAADDGDRRRPSGRSTRCVRLAARAPADLPDWHYDDVDAALLDGRVDAAAAWPGGWGAIRDRRAPARLRRTATRPGRDAARVLLRAATRGRSRRPAATSTARSRSSPICSAPRRRRSTPSGGACARTATRSPRSSRRTTIDRRRLEITRATIDDAMITYPPLRAFPRSRTRAGRRSVRRYGDTTAGGALASIQTVAEHVLAET